MKLYVAGKWSEMEWVGQRIVELQGLGYEITHDWTKVEQSDRSKEALGRYGKFDIDGVKGSDVLVALLTDKSYPYRGTFCEIGCALGTGRKVLVMTPEGYDSDGKWPCFFYHPDIVHVSSWTDVLEKLKSWSSFKKPHLVVEEPIVYKEYDYYECAGNCNDREMWTCTCPQWRKRKTTRRKRIR